MAGDLKAADKDTWRRLVEDRKHRKSSGYGRVLPGTEGRLGMEPTEEVVG